MKAILTSGAALLLAACASAPPVETASAGETYIPFIKSTGVLEWKAVGAGTLYVRSATNQWYLVRTMNACSRLHSDNALGFVTVGMDQLDRHGVILAEGWRCPLRSVTLSGPPPERQRG